MNAALRRRFGISALSLALLIGISSPSCARPRSMDVQVVQNDGSVDLTGRVTGAEGSVISQGRRTSGGDVGFVPPYPFGASPSHPNFRAWQEAITGCPEDGNIEKCIGQFNDMLRPVGGGSVAPPSRDDVAGVARQAVLRLGLPVPSPRVGPDPSANEWKMAVVGYPLWLWVDGPRMVSKSSRDYGIALRLSATLHHVEFAMGDGQVVSCADFASYPVGVKPGTKSPLCGYAYQRASLPKGSYEVTATAYWTVNWSGLGYTGVLTAVVDDTRQLGVGELQAVLVR